MRTIKLAAVLFGVLAALLTAECRPLRQGISKHRRLQTGAQPSMIYPWQIVANGTNTVYELISTLPELNMTKAAVDALDMGTVLNDTALTSNTTFFLPSNEAWSYAVTILKHIPAFANISTFDDLLARPDLLAPIVAYAIAEDELLWASEITDPFVIGNRTEYKIVYPSTMAWNITRNATTGEEEWATASWTAKHDVEIPILWIVDVFYDQSITTMPDMSVGGAAVHVMDTVLMPAEFITTNLVGLEFGGPEWAGRFSTARQLIIATDMVTAANVTVLVPTEAAFAACDNATLDKLMTNETFVAEVMSTLVLEGGVPAASLREDKVYQTLNPEAAFGVQFTDDGSVKLVGQGSIAGQEAVLSEWMKGVNGTFILTVDTLFIPHAPDACKKSLD